MKQNNTIWLLLLALSSLCTSCKKDAPQDELSKLPPATQTGANTFGCLVNGKAFVPIGYGSTGRSNPHVLYEYDLQGQPFLSLKASIFDNRHESIGGISIGFRYLNDLGNYPLSDSFSIAFGGNAVIENCGNASWDPNVYCRGGVYHKVRYSKQNHQWNICLCIQKLILRYCQNN